MEIFAESLPDSQDTDVFVYVYICFQITQIKDQRVVLGSLGHYEWKNDNREISFKRKPIIKNSAAWNLRAPHQLLHISFKCLFFLILLYCGKNT